MGLGIGLYLIHSLILGKPRGCKINEVKTSVQQRANCSRGPHRGFTPKIITQKC